MTIDRQRFLAGEEAGTLREETEKALIDLLSEDRDKAYTFREISSRISLNRAIPGGIASSVYLVSILDDLIEEKKILSRRMGKRTYYAIA